MQDSLFKKEKTLQKYKLFLINFQLLEDGWVDVFRDMNPDLVKYTWWSARTGARAKGVGWRLDYCLVDSKNKKKVDKFFVRDDIYGSDHCPIEVEVNLE